MKMLNPTQRQSIYASTLVLLLASCSAPPPVLVPVVTPKKTVVVGVGDILLGRKLGEMMYKSNDYTLGFARMQGQLASADIAFGNLEGPFCDRGPYPPEGMIFHVRPEAIGGLERAGFDVMNVANNHVGDAGEDCIGFTLDHLRKSKIAAVGAGRDYEEAHRGEVVERNGLRVAFLGYTYAARNDNSPEAQQKLQKKSVPVVAGRSPENVRRDVAAALTRADVVIVSLHDGAEYSQRVAKETVDFAQAAIDAGATVVLGHHPHVPQRVEPYKDGWIFYSLGNFVFQQNTPAATKTALMARLTFSGKSLDKVEAVPIVIEWYSEPRVAIEVEGNKILKSIGLEKPVIWERSGVH